MKKIIFIIVLMVYQTDLTLAARINPESYYQNKWCSINKGITEYKLQDSTRVDCLTKKLAVEFDFANKWAEAIGQSLHYARMTQKNPAIGLIIEKPSDIVYYNRIKPLCKNLGITLFEVQDNF